MSRSSGLAVRVLLVAALCGYLYVGTSRYGVGLTVDSVRYLSCAESLLDGNGFRTFDGQAMVAWPPLYPSVLALLGLTGLELGAAARILNLLVVPATAWILLLLGERILVRREVRMLYAPAVVVSAAVHGVGFFAFSEPLFNLLVAATLLLLVGHPGREGGSGLGIAAALAGLAALQRHLGIALGLTVVVVGTVRAWRAGGVRPALRRGSGLAAIAFLPLLLWQVGSDLLIGGAAGRLLSLRGLGAVLAKLATNLASFFVPALVVPVGPGDVLLAVTVAVGLGFLLVQVRSCGTKPKRWNHEEHEEHEGRRRRGKGGRAGSGTARFPTCLLLFALLYLALLLVASQMVKLDGPTPRFLSPLAGPVLIGSCVLLSGILVRVHRVAPRRLVLILAAFLLVGGPAAEMIRVLRLRSVSGAGGFATTPWQESETVRWLREARDAGLLDGKRLISNCPPALFALLGIVTEQGPRTEEEARRFLEDLAADPCARLIVLLERIPGRRELSERSLRVTGSVAAAEGWPVLFRSADGAAWRVEGSVAGRRQRGG